VSVRSVPGRNKSPTSVHDFLRTISPEFNHSYLKGFEANCDRFDHIIGGSNYHNSTSSSSSHQVPTLNLSDIFMCDLSFGSWIAKIRLAIALHCFETVAPGGKLAQRLMPQYDGPPDTPPPSIQAGVLDDGGTFKQVILVSPNLYEAWNRLSFTRNLENTCPQSSTWTLSQPGGLYVYHRTAVHLDHADFILALANRPFNGLMGNSQRNQITQGKESIPVVWTVFSPFRAFLWAEFVADVIEDIPGPKAQSRLTSVWQCGNKTYEGVIVLQFSSTQSSPPGCSSYTIPIGQEEQWSAIAAAGSGLASNEPTKNFWAKFATIHNQAGGSEWPDLVHGLELRSSRFTKQFWRTVWFGQGIQSLNSRHSQSLAIRYIIKPDSPLPCRL